MQGEFALHGAKQADDRRTICDLGAFQRGAGNKPHPFLSYGPVDSLLGCGNRR
jgi:hypothetical protein